MSLILEALRKSEAERRRGQVADIHRDLPIAPVAPRISVPNWLWWSGALLATVVLLLVLQAWRARTPAASPVIAVTPASPPARPALPPVARLSPAAPPTVRAPGERTSPAPPVLETPGSATSARPAPAPATSPMTSQSPTPPTPASADGGIASPPAAQAAKPADDTISLSDLGVDERKALPPLKLSMHLWNTDPAQRFVILDGNRLHEGDRAGDAVVTSITEDGVILDWNGRRIRLSIR